LLPTNLPFSILQWERGYLCHSSCAQIPTLCRELRMHSIWAAVWNKLIPIHWTCTYFFSLFIIVNRFDSTRVTDFSLWKVRSMSGAYPTFCSLHIGGGCGPNLSTHSHCQGHSCFIIILPSPFFSPAYVVWSEVPMNGTCKRTSTYRIPLLWISDWVSQLAVVIAAIVTGLYILCGVLKQPIVFTESKSVPVYPTEHRRRMPYIPLWHCCSLPKQHSFIIKTTTVWILTTMETSNLALRTVCHLWNLRRMITELQQCMKTVTCCTKVSTFRKVSLGILRGEKEESFPELPLFYILSPFIYKALGSIVDHFNCKKIFNCKSDSVRMNWKS
jgi:hypothetical protein